MSGPLGLIAGDGRFPLEIARAAADRGRPVVAVGFHELTSRELEAAVPIYRELHLGQLAALLECLREYAVEEVVLAGKVPKTFLFRDRGVVRPDAKALSLLARVGDRGDDTLLGAVAQALEEAGVRLLEQASWVPHLLATEGVWGSVRPNAAQLRDVRLGWDTARALGRRDIGQSVVVKQGAVMAVEAIEGTDAAIRRGGALGGQGVVVVKLAKPAQDPRFDLPAVGLGTMDSLIECSASMLAVEAGATVVLDREEAVRRADANGIAIAAFPAEGPQEVD